MLVRHLFHRGSVTGMIVRCAFDACAMPVLCPSPRSACGRAFNAQSKLLWVNSMLGWCGCDPRLCVRCASVVCSTRGFALDVWLMCHWGLLMRVVCLSMLVWPTVLRALRVRCALRALGVPVLRALWLFDDWWGLHFAAKENQFSLSYISRTHPKNVWLQVDNGVLQMIYWLSITKLIVLQSTY